MSFSVTPSASTRYLSFATMVVESNDLFIAPPAGIDLLDATDGPRDPAEIETEVQRSLAIWNAGTEVDQIPGAGPDQALRQSASNTGAADPTGTIRRYYGSQATLADLTPFVEVAVVASGTPGEFNVTVSTLGVAQGYPVLTPVAWATHSEAFALFNVDTSASAGLESLAEDGDPATLLAALEGDAGVGSSGVMATPAGPGPPGPILPGDSYTFSVVPTTTARYLSFATMVVPSNDLFLAFGPAGVALLDVDGSARSDAAIAIDVATSLGVWDAGTEQNQAGASGSNQAPRQTAANTGEAEGNALVRAVPDGVWGYPDVADLVRVSVRPAE